MDQKAASKKRDIVMKPEGSLKITVANASRQVDQVIEGEWTTIQVLSDATLPKGSYYLSDTVKASKNVYPQDFTGQVLHMDKSSVYQLSGKAVVQHDRGLFKKEPSVGTCYDISYRRGIGSVNGELGKSDGAQFGDR